MESPKITIVFVYSNGTVRTQEFNLWHHLEIFSFKDKGVERVMIEGRSFYNQTELDAFFKGVSVVRDLLISFAN